MSVQLAAGRITGFAAGKHLVRRAGRPRWTALGSPNRFRVSRDLANLSDEAVVALVARAEESALGELYDRYGDAAYALARRVVRDSSLAEDVVQEAFLAVWRGARRFAPGRGRVSSWILMLVHRRAVDLVRREQRRHTEPLQEASSDGLAVFSRDGAGPSAADAVWLQVERARVQAALAQLSEQQRELLQLAYYGGLTQSELAAHVGRPLGTVKSQLYAALDRLRESLAEASAEEESWTS